MFNTIAIEVTSLCNRQCSWCPVAYNHRPDERMDEVVLHKILLELGDMNYAGRIELYIYNEPTRDMPYLLSTIQEVRRQVPRACIMIATNGDYLRGAAGIDRLFAAGLNQLLINCYTPKLFERRVKWLENRSDIGDEIYSYVSPRRHVVQMLDKSSPETFGVGIFRLVNRAGNVPEFMPATPEPVARMCVKPFRLLNINWKGEALVCCQDYHGHVPIGTVSDQTLMQLWDSPVINAYRQHLLKKDRSLPLCRSCDCHAGAYPSNVPHPTGPVARIEQIEAAYELNSRRPK
jgi:hypothetical protein